MPPHHINQKNHSLDDDTKNQMPSHHINQKNHKKNHSLDYVTI